ncbi:MoxR family ATPase [Candidatus Methylospira mobilis]|uniref:MoxR family ATPase n=1 Tax=Candidatus Methylospira mobilis TaxID=1808979 RepID=A0A5Q0BGD3_9GAMM|nr:MoxR family ATPase [Candidatus Methylospira mobilis]QFY42599.1 MoxR family ATPase [Candidatus Methylospira mobilis]WNV04286.1 MoxR family ATPase [Candidatus Methylospira mobilis]
MISDSRLADFRATALAFENHIRQVIIGQDGAIRLMTIAVFARGHVLLEGGVGVGKTTLLRAVARAVGGAYERIEGTVDLMPSDLIYYTYLDEKGKPGVSPGPLLKYGEGLSTFFFNEINRARPQVHSLLLRVMAERSMTAFNREFVFPHLQVFADRNRVEKEETFELPAAARDRFMMEIRIEAPTDRVLLDRLMVEPRFHHIDSLIETIPAGLLSYTALNELAETLQNRIHVSERLRSYVLDLVLAAWQPQKFGIGLGGDAEGSGELLDAGVSPRGMSYLLRLARVHAWLNARDQVVPEDIQTLFAPAIAHRLFLKPMFEYRRNEIIPELISGLLRGISAP